MDFEQVSDDKGEELRTQLSRLKKIDHRDINFKVLKEYQASRDSQELKKLRIEQNYRVNYAFIEKDRVLRIFYYNFSHMQEAKKELLDFIKAKMKQVFRFKVKASL